MSGAVRRPPGGLCDSCAHQRLVRTTRGSEFSMCERAHTDPRYRKYPPLPVVACGGWEAAPAAPPAGDRGA